MNLQVEISRARCEKALSKARGYDKRLLKIMIFNNNHLIARPSEWFKLILRLLMA